MSEQLTSRIIKGGALLEDTRRLVDLWDPGQTPEANVSAILEQNLLAKPSRSRLREVMDLVLRPRFIEPGPHVIASLKILQHSPAAFREACYYEAARVDPLLARFAGDMLASSYRSGRTVIGLDDVDDWLHRLPDAVRWSDTVRRRVAHGLLATLRDFGVLEGGVRKRLVRPHLSVLGLAYAAYREHQQGRASRALVDSPVWSWWLLDEAQVDSLFADAARQGFLRYSVAGSVVRIDWTVRSLEDLARAAA